MEKMQSNTQDLELDSHIPMDTDDYESESKTERIKIRFDGEDIQLGVDFSLNSLSRQPRGKYRFIRSIGFGGMKTVTEVRDKDTGRNVAMASIPDAAERHISDLYRFVQEAVITARLEHPNIVPIHDIGIDASGAPYFTMKLLKGHTLSRLIKKLQQKDPVETAKYNEERLLSIFVRICNAVAFAHSKSIIHLDLKPDNVHIGEFGEVLILDWGLAKYIGLNDHEVNPLLTYYPDYADDPELKHNGSTLDGVARGTPGYMAPEQAAGLNSQKDQRSDIYALGAILYAMMTYHSPISGTDVKKMLITTIRGEIPAPNEVEGLEHSIPAALEAIILKAMRHNPDERYQTVTELRDDLFSYMDGYATKAESAGPLKKFWLFLVRNGQSIVFLTTLLILMFLCGLLIWLFYSGALEFSFG